jgi:iron complex outermembrane receptor protein
LITKGERIVQPYLRGVGSSVNTVGFESSVAIYVDGVYFPRLPSAFLSLANVERVEVLKGPQGTLFGRNASGGLIQILTSDPSLSKIVANGSLSFGNYDILSGDLYASAPLGDKVAASITINGVHQGDGFGTNITTGHKTAYDNNLSLRSKLLFQASDTTKILISGYYIKSQTGLQGSAFPGTTQGFSTAPFAAYAPLPGFFDQRGDVDELAKSKGWGGSVKIEQDFDFAKLTSITSYQKINEFTDTDADYGPRDDVHAFLYGYTNTISQELQLASSPGPFQWTTGLYFFRSQAKYDPVLFRGAVYSNPAVDIFGDQTSRSYAGYAQGTLKITDQINMTLGGRYTHDKVSADGTTDIIFPGGTPITVAPSNPQTDKSNHFSFKAALDYSPVPGVMTYASFSRGYKAGTFAILPFNPAVTKAETLDAYEIGLKSELFDRHVRFNAAAFYYDIGNPQVQLLRSGSILLSNAQSARIKGIDVDIEAAPAHGLTMRLAATYLDAKYKRYTDAPSSPQNPTSPFGAVATPVLVDASGNQMVHAPKLTVSASVNYRVDTSFGELSFDGSYVYNSGFFWEPDNLLRQKRFGLIDGKVRLGLTENIGLSVWGKNLANKHYYAWAASQSGPPGYPYIGAPPITYGVTADFKF